jgi:hypothetical protein
LRSLTARRDVWLARREVSSDAELLLQMVLAVAYS